MKAVPRKPVPVEVLIEYGFEPCRWEICERTEVHPPCTPAELEKQRRIRVRDEKLQAQWYYAWVWYEAVYELVEKTRERMTNGVSQNARANAHVKDYHKSRLEEAGYKPKYEYTTESGQVLRTEWSCPLCNGQGSLSRGCSYRCTLCLGRGVVAATHSEMFMILTRERILK